MLVLSVLFVTFLIAYLISNWGAFIEYVRYRYLFQKLPTLKGNYTFFGHILSQLGIARQSDALWKMCRQWNEEGTPLYTLSMGPVTQFVFLCDADDIETLVSSTKHIRKSNLYKFLDKWLGKGLLVSSGDLWHTRRKILTPAFHFSILREFIDIFTREANILVEKIEKDCSNGPVNVTALVTEYTLYTINETSMGVKLDTATKEGRDYKQAVYDIGEVLFNRAITPLYYFNFYHALTQNGFRENRLVKILHQFTDNVIHRRAKNFKIFDIPGDDEADGYLGKSKKRPLLDILLNAKFKNNSIDEKGIRDEVNTFMMEGHDTTAVSLIFSCMLLACHKDIQEDVYQEIKQILGPGDQDPTFNDLQELALLERCIKESLRLYPSVGLYGRVTGEDISTKYGVIPRGSHAFIHVYDLHRNPKYWPDPDKFDPSRHVPENARGRHPFSYLPFSAGPRNCIGQRFAMLEMKAALCAIVRKFTLEPVDTPDTVVMIQEVLLRARDPIKVRFIPRETNVNE